MPEMSFTEAIQSGMQQAMNEDACVHVFGLGVNYPNGADGTTGGLDEMFPRRVHDIPCSENAATGMCVGAAVTGLRPIIHHGRVEFALFAADQILTQAAKWNYMFGGDYPCPLVVRVALGRQWGNGPQHTYVARSLFAIPGLKVVCPGTPAEAKGLLTQAVLDDNPVIYLEHRWIYKLRGNVQERPSWAPLDRCRVARQGTDVTIVAVGDMFLEALRAAERLQDNGVEAEVIDLTTIHPIDYETIFHSVVKTGRLIIADSGTPAFNIGRDIAAVVGKHAWDSLKRPPEIVSCPSAPCPTAPSMCGEYYPTDDDILAAVGELLDLAPMIRQPRTFAELNLAPNVNISTLEKRGIPVH